MGNRSSALVAALVGITIGSAEVVFILQGIRNAPLFDSLLLFLHAWVSYGLIALIAFLVFRRMGAVGIAVASCLSIRLIWQVVQIKRPELAWLIPACILLAFFIGWLIHRFARWSELHRPRLWVLCILVLTSFGLLKPVLTRETASARAAADAPNILLISIDTLRSDRLGSYGYERAKTPVLDNFAREGVMFEQATSPVALTGPSHTSMLTGLHPIHHGAVRNGMRINRNVETIPQLLARNGYQTAGFVSGWTLKDEASGLGNRFHFYDEDFYACPFFPQSALNLPLYRLVLAALTIAGSHQDPLERTGEVTTDRAIRWLTRSSNNPFFMFVHYFDPHSPYEAPASYQQMHESDVKGEDPNSREHKGQMYDAEISYVDSQIGRLLEKLKEGKLENRTIVIITADHGESLTEHNFYFDHGEYFYDTCVRVPLLVRFPDRKYSGTRISSQVRLMDIAPTVLEFARSNTPRLDGSSLLPLINGKESGDRIALGSLFLGNRQEPRSRHYVRLNGYKLIWNFDKQLSEELYDLETDPGELKNILQEQPSILGNLRKEITAWVRLPHLEKGTEPSEEVKEKLRSLGYLE